MNEKEKDLDLSLDDIMQEFSPLPEEAAAEDGALPNESPDDADLDDLIREFVPLKEESAPEPEDEIPPEPEAALPQEEYSSLRLEDIMREFTAPEESDPQEPESVPQEAEPMVLDEIIKEYNPGKKPAAPVDLEQTQRFDPLGDAPVPPTRAMTDDTIALPAQGTMDDTIRFTPVGQEAPPIVPPTAPKGAEPFSAEWEPEYEQPMGEYIPAEPIVFRTKSRLSELKRKLVAGPERRYYALLEQGLGKYQISIFLSLLVVILAVSSVILYRLGMVQECRMRLLVFGELFAMVFSALLGSERILDGFVALFRGRFNLDSLLTVTFLVCIADGIFCLQEVRVPFCAAFCLEMTMSLWAEYQRRNTEMGQMDTMRKATHLNRVAKAPDCYENRPGFFVTDGEVEDFMDSYKAPSGPEKAANRYALAALLASFAIGVAGYFQGGISTGLSTWSAAILAATPVSIFICNTRPAAVLERRLHKLGVVLCGWKGIVSMSGSAVMPLTDRDLFPAGSVKINGVKFYSDRDTEQTIAYATAVLVAGQSSLADLFTQLLESRNGYHYNAENLRIYEAGGIGGEIAGESVLVGNLSFLQSMGVEIPDGTRVNQAVYVSVDGYLCGVFALAFGRLKGVTAALNTLCGYRGLTPVLVSDSFLLSEGFIRAKFGINTRRFAFPGMQERDQITKWNPDPETSIPCALTTQDGLASAAFSITGARALRTAVILGTTVHIVGGIVGLLTVLILTLTGGAELLTPANLLIFELIWTLPGLLITEWTRSI